MPLQRFETHVSSQSSRVEIRTGCVLVHSCFDFKPSDRILVHRSNSQLQQCEKKPRPPRPEGCMGRGRLKNKHFHRKPSQATQLRQHLEMIWAFPTGLITFPSLDRLHPVREWVQTPGSSLFNFRFGPSTGIQSVQLQICCKFRKLKQVPLQRVETHISSQSSRVEIRTMNVPSVGP